ncbi:C-Jun-amino-terminal kinase-interacting protein 1a [Astyanax mexicanus]|uniref:C-Jun-amino-terminal kinase-interacting protein 1a n=1 Tax=Astyanax mexicanus TaxID=7994 RepID=UPI0020CABE3B|nr:C-Jun-amino-terminal kinase-interacting protein 1a [Astyanax mexicanus]
MVLCLAMDSREDGDSWMEDQWEKWLTHDMSLDEYEDDDLSEVTEITDERGGSLSLSDYSISGHVSESTNGGEDWAGRRGAVELQAEMLQLDLIDAEGGSQEEEEEEERERLLLLIDEHTEGERAAGLPATEPPLRDLEPPALIDMDTYRPKRPTTLNLFPQVPRTQDTINNNSFGEKDRRKEKKTHSSSPHIKGDLPPKAEQANQTDGDKVQASIRVNAKPHAAGSSAHKAPDSVSKKQDKPTDTAVNNVHTAQPSTQTDMREMPRDGTLIEGLHDADTISKEKAHYHTLNGCREQVQYPVENGCTHPQPTDKNKDYRSSDVGKEAAQEIHLTPVNGEQERPFLSQSSDSNRMSISSDTELPPLHFHPLTGRANPSISEEDEVYPPTPPCRTDSLSELTEPVAKAGAGDKAAANAAVSKDASGLSYDSVKYTLVVDEHAKLELVSLKQCYQGYDSDSDNTVYESAIDEDEDEHDVDDEEEESGAGGINRDTSSLSVDSNTDSTSDVPRSRKFVNVFVNRRSRFTGAESFGIFSCIIDGEEREQSHRAVFRFIPRHEDELEMEADDPLLMEVQAEDLWCEAYNMRTGSRGIFPAFYAVQVTKDMRPKEVKSDWLDSFWLKFLGSVQVPYHKGNDVLCAAMQKIATNRRTMRFSPPSACIVEINIRGVKIIVQDDCQSSERGDKCCHFFQLKNISFCGCHPKNSKYFGLITKHPAHQRFACHVFFSEEHGPHLASSVGKAFQQFYKEHMEYSCPTEDIFLE